MLKEELKEMLDSNDVISFDIFDTLLLRNVLRPEDIFRVVGRYADEKYGIDEFYDNRIIAEAEARKKVKNHEANYEEIYQEIEKIYNKNVDGIKKYELEMEYKFITVNPYMHEVWKYALNHGKTVAFISDMYLENGFIEKLLVKCGYTVNELYISNEYRENKAEKGLYDVVYKKKNWNKEKWLHIGDNLQSDYKKAIEYGINAYHYKNVLSQYHGTKELSIGESILLGMQNNYLYNGIKHDYWEDFGVHYAFPIYFGFVKWLYELTKNESNMYFFARDGYIIKKIYELFCKKDNNNIYTNYLYVSRKVLQLPELANLDTMDKLVLELTNRAGFGDTKPTLREILKGAGITDFASANSYKEAFGFISLDEKVPKEKHYMAQNLVVKLIDEVRRKLLENREKVQKYFEQEGIDQWEHINIMDVGWRGSCQEVLKNLVQKKITGYYLGTVETSKNNRFCDMYGWLFDDGNPYGEFNITNRYIMLYEFLFSAPHGSVIDYKIEDGKVKPVLNNNTTYNEIIDKFQKKAIEMCKVALEYDEYFDIINPRIACEQYREYLERKDEKDVRMFEKLSADFMIGNSKMYPYVQKLNECLSEIEMKNGNLQKLREKKEKGFWKGAYVFSDNVIASENERNLFKYRLREPFYDKEIYKNYFKYNLAYARIYYDFGEGFKEANSVIVPMVNMDMHYLLAITIDLEVKGVRIDPIEKHYIQYRNYAVYIDGEKQEVLVPRSERFAHNGWKKIKSEDPYFVVEMKKRKISTILFESDLRIVF